MATAGGGGVVMRARWGAVLLVVAAAAMGCASRPPSSTFDVTVQAYEIEIPGASTPVARQGGLVVGSYNVYQMAKPDALRADLAALPFVDVWAMQEVPVPRPMTAEDDAARHRAAFRESLRKILPPGTWHVRAAAVNATSTPGWTCEGQVIASRRPIRDATVWPLGGHRKRRVALAAFIDVNGGDARAPAGTVAVVNTDHEPGFFSFVPGNDAQVTRLLEHLAACEAPAVVAGDFNPTGHLFRFRSHPADVARLRRAMSGGGFANSAHVDDHTFRGFPIRLRLDHLFLRGLRWLDGGVDGTGRGSDHFPVWCRVEPIAVEPAAPAANDQVTGCAGS